MKPTFESISFDEHKSSFKYFQFRAPSLDSYWHYHPEIELTYVKNGKGLRFAGDHISSFQEGDLLLSGFNLPHDRVSSEDSSGEKIVYVIQFSHDLFDKFPECYKINQLLEESRFGVLFPNPSASLIDRIESLHDLSELNRFLSILQIFSELTEMKKVRLSSVSFSDKIKLSKDQKRISEITSFILNNLHKSLTLDSAAKFSGLAVPSFCRWFKQSVGNSFVTFLNMARIEKACQCLLTTDLNISEIAYQTGFESISHFNRTFKKLKSKSPRDYRKNLQA